MALPTDCYYKISKYLRDKDYINFCTVVGIPVNSKNMTKSFTRRSVLKLYAINVNLAEILDELDWRVLSRHSRLPNNFMYDYKDYLNWTIVSQCHKLTVDFLRIFKNYVKWHIISNRRRLGHEIMMKFRSYLTIDLVRYPRLQRQIIAAMRKYRQPIKSLKHNRNA